MFKKIVACMAMLAAASCFAAVDANKASVAELDGIKGVGPSLSQLIVDARKGGEFKTWDDFMARVKGVKAKKAERLSAQGLTINGEGFNPGTTAPVKAGPPAQTVAAPAVAAPVVASPATKAAPVAVPSTSAKSTTPATGNVSK